MKFRTSIVIGLFSALTFGGARATVAQEAPEILPAAATQPAVRPAIAVATFDTNRTGWVPPPNFGETVADLLSSRLVDLGAFRVFDRGLLPDNIPDRRASLDAVRDLAQQSGVDFVVLGAVTRFANEKKTSRGGLLGIPFIGGGGKNSQESSVGLTIRVIDVRTGEIVSTTTALGAASKSNRTVGGGAIVHGLPIGALHTTGSTGSLDRLVGNALADAVEEAAAVLTKAAARMSKTFIPSFFM